MFFWDGLFSGVMLYSRVGINPHLNYIHIPVFAIIFNPYLHFSKHGIVLAGTCASTRLCNSTYLQKDSWNFTAQRLSMDKILVSGGAIWNLIECKVPAAYCILGNEILINSLIRVLLNKKGCNLRVFVKLSAQGGNQPHSDQIIEAPFQTSTGQVNIQPISSWRRKTCFGLTFLCLRGGQALGARI